MQNVIERAPAAKKQFSNYLQQQQLRATPQRESILEVFVRADTHLSAEELFALIKKEDNTIGQATVYRTLRLLTEAGVAREVDFRDGSMRYELAVGRDPHDHMICQDCGMSIEVFNQEVAEALQTIAESNGFTLMDRAVYLYGYCSDCAPRKGA